jgi:hypothetical protein
MPERRTKGVTNMANPSPYDYHYGSEADQYMFYRLPKALFTDERFRNLSDGAKILYGLMLDRMGLSIKNGWLDERNRVYIYFTLEDVTEQMNCKNDKAVKILAELYTVKGVGLIERVRQGQGKPAIIYVRKFVETAEVLTTEKPKSALRKSRSQDFGKSECNKNNINNTELNDTEYQSIYLAREQENLIDRIEAYREIIRENISYDILCERHGDNRVDEAMELILEVLASQRPYIRIAGDEYPATVVKSRMMKLDASHVEYVFGCMDENATKIRSIKSYPLTALYNAPATIGSYYRAEVNHDLYGESG